MSGSQAQRWPAWFGFAALLIGIAVAIVASIPIGASGHAGTSVTAAQNDVLTVIQDLGWVGAAVYLALQRGAVRPGDFGLRFVGWRRALGLVLGGLAAFFVLSTVWFAAVHSSGREPEVLKDIGADSGTLGILAACALVSVLAPICEELLFRGFMFRALSNWRGPWPAAVITGIVFGLVHGLSAPAVDLVPLAFLGFVLCAIYHFSGSIYPCIAVHVINNAVAFGSAEHWVWRTVELLGASLATVALVLGAVRLASARWIPASD